MSEKSQAQKGRELIKNKASWDELLDVCPRSYLLKAHSATPRMLDFAYTHNQKEIFTNMVELGVTAFRTASPSLWIHTTVLADRCDWATKVLFKQDIDDKRLSRLKKYYCERRNSPDHLAYLYSVIEEDAPPYRPLLEGLSEQAHTEQLKVIARKTNNTTVANNVLERSASLKNKDLANTAVNNKSNWYGGLCMLIKNRHDAQRVEDAVFLIEQAPRATDYEASMVLYHIAEHGNDKMLRNIVDAGFDVDGRLRDGVGYIGQYGSNRMLKTLREAGADMTKAAIDKV